MTLKLGLQIKKIIMNHNETRPKLRFIHKEIGRVFINNETVHFCKFLKIISVSLNVFIV